MKKFSGRYESGSALIAVLFLIFTGGIIAMSVLALSKSGTFTVYAHVERQRSMLIMEGAATRIQWLMAGDAKLFPDEIPGETDYTAFEHDRFMADGVYHEIDYYGEKIRFSITDTVSGDDVVNDTTKVLNRVGTTESEEIDMAALANRVRIRITDYTDSNDDVNEESWESSEYEEAGFKPLPRNAAFGFREELSYIQEFSALYPPDKNGRLTSVRLVPPSGSPATTGTPSLFTADARMLRNYCGIEEEKVQEVLDALEAWRNERTLLSETLDEEMLGKLKAGLSVKESGLYTVNIESADKSKPFARLCFSFPGFSVSGPPGQLIEYLEWSFY